MSKFLVLLLESLKIFSELLTSRRVGVDIFVLLMPASASASASASHQLLREPLLNYFWEAYILFPRALAFDFCCDLDLCSHGQAVEHFSSEWVFPNFVKTISRILINWSESFIDRWHMT